MCRPNEWESLSEGFDNILGMMDKFGESIRFYFYLSFFVLFLT